MADPTRDERLAALLERYGQVLRRAIARVCPPDAGLDFDEIEQQARIRLWKALERERNIREPASFLYRVAVTATLDAVRRARARGGPARQAIDPAETMRTEPRQSPESQTLRRELLRLLLDRLKRLPDNRRRAVALHLQGFSSTEIAELLAWTEPKARNLVHRGLCDLRRWLREEGIEYVPE